VVSISEGVSWFSTFWCTKAEYKSCKFHVEQFFNNTFNPQCLRKIMWWVYLFVHFCCGQQQNSCAFLPQAAPSRGILVTVAHMYSLCTSSLFWAGGRRDECLASGLWMCLRKVSFKNSACRSHSSTCCSHDRWKSICTICVSRLTSGVAVASIPLEVSCSLRIRAETGSFLPCICWTLSWTVIFLFGSDCLLNKQKIDCLKNNSNNNKKT